MYVCRECSCIEKVKSKDLVGRVFRKRILFFLYLQLVEYFRMSKIVGKENSRCVGIIDAEFSRSISRSVDSLSCKN